MQPRIAAQIVEKADIEPEDSVIEVGAGLGILSELLAKAGFIVRDIPEGHLCCGSAGTYNMLQSDIAARLLARKVANIAETSPELVATGNIGCITQIASGISIPVVHTVELLDWATGGPLPQPLKATGFSGR